MLIRGRVLFLSLISMGVLAAILSMVQMWTDLLSWDDFLKTMGTILIIGSEISFLIAVDYDLPASRRKWLMLGLVALSIAATLIVTLQIWAQILAWSVFVKIMATIFIIVLLLSFFLVVAEDFGSNKRLRDKNYLD